MHRNWRVAILAAGVVSLLGSGILAASGEGLQAFLARVKGMSLKDRGMAIRKLSPAERKQLHREYRALSPEGKKAANEALGRAQKAKERAPRNTPGTIQYDTGVAHGLRVNTPRVVGNNFNQGVRDPTTILSVSLQPAGTFGSAVLAVFGPPSGTVAPVLTIFTAQLQGTPVPLPVPLVVAGGQFEAGMLQSGSSTTPSPSFAAVEVDINNGGFGFHGMSVSLNGSGFNPSPQVFPGLPFNAIFRATCSIVPVELMNFNVQ